MKKIIILLSLVFLCSINAFAQQSFNAKVVGVVDGDTITVTTKDKRQLMFRLAGIDAPEKDQNFGGDAHQFLFNLILDQNVSVSDFKKDCLDRFTGAVFFKNKNLSLSLVESGNAWADSTCQTDETLVKAELSAREKRAGLWQSPNPIRPIVFVKSKQAPVQPQVSQTQSRRIFTGLAPIPPPPRKGLYIGMTVESFKAKCGDKAKTSKLYTSEGYQSFDLSLAETEENIDKGCAGSFTFRRTSDNATFQLTTAFQVL